MFVFTIHVRLFHVVPRASVVFIQPFRRRLLFEKNGRSFSRDSFCVLLENSRQPRPFDVLDAVGCVQLPLKKFNFYMTCVMVNYYVENFFWFDLFSTCEEPPYIRQAASGSDDATKCRRVEWINGRTILFRRVYNNARRVDSRAAVDELWRHPIGTSLPLARNSRCCGGTKL
jgi:hypothetical protein